MIDGYRFGSITIDQQEYGCDVIVRPGRVSQWVQYVRHQAGLADVGQAFLSHPAAVVIGTGESGMLVVDESVVGEADRQGIHLIVAPTGRAIKEYNRLEQGGSTVIGLFHITC